MTKGQKIIFGFVVGVPLVCCLGGFGVVEGLFGGASAQDDREVALARQEGIPTNPAELARTTEIPSSEDAYPVYIKLLQLVADGSPEYKEAKAVGDALGLRPTAKQIEAADAAHPKIGPVLALARQAGSYPHVRVPRDWAKGPMVLFPDFAKIKLCARVLLFEAGRRDKQGDWRGALTDVASAQRLGRQCEDSPIMIGMLVHLAIEAMTERVLDQLIDRHSHDTTFLAAAKRIHDDFGPLANYRRAMYGEVVMARIAIAQLKSPREFTSDGPDERITPNAFETAFFQSHLVRSAFDAKLLHYYRAMIAGIPADGARWEDAERSSEKIGAQIEADHSVSNMLNQILFPVFTQAAIAIGTMEAHRRLTNTTLKLLIERAQTGKLPRFLPKSYGEDRMDPFNENPLIYRTQGGGFILYSVGQDRVDNGGTPRGTEGASGFDEVVTVH